MRAERFDHRAGRRRPNRGAGPATGALPRTLTAGGSSAADGLAIRVLGPLEVDVGDGPVDLGTPKQRHLLLLLAADAGRVVGVDALVEELWPGAPRPRDATAIRPYVSRLRRALGPAAHRLDRRGDGYVLLAADDEIDARRFEALVGAGREARATGDHGGAASLLREALRLWRGRAFDGAAHGSLLPEACRLDELRLGALEERIDAELALGAHPALVAELESLCATHPLREQLWRLLALALYRTGRQADALRRLDSARAVLLDQLGVDPGPELRALERAILDHDPELRWVPDDGGGTTVAATSGLLGRPPAPVPPALAAAARRPLVGRRGLLVALRRALVDEGERLVVLAGDAGIGKTRLAAELAVATWERGAVVLHAAATGPGGVPLGPLADALAAHFAAAPDVLARAGAELRDDVARLIPGAAEPEGPPALPALDPLDTLRRALGLVAGGRALLLVVDDLHWADPATVTALSALAADDDLAELRIVATVRTGEGPRAPLASARTLEVPPLGPEEVTTLAAGLRGAIDADLGRALHRRTGGVPFFVEEVLREVEHRADVRAALEAVPPTVRAVLAARWEHLDDDARELLTLAGCATGPVDAVLLGDALDRDVRRVVAGLDRAADLGLLAADDTAPGRYQFPHPLAREVVTGTVSPARRAVSHRTLADALERRHPDPDTDALRALAHHHAQGAMVGDPGRAAAAGLAAGRAALAHGAYEEAVHHAATALEALDRAGDGASLDAADLWLLAGEAWSNLGRHDRVVAAARAALDRARRLGAADRAARAALLLPGTRPDPTAAPVLGEARAALADDHPLVAELLLAEAWQLAEVEPVRSSALAARALERARADGDLAVLARHLEHTRWFAAGRTDPAELLARADELLRHLVDLDRPVLELSAHSHRAVALLELGDLDGAERAVAANERVAHRIRTPWALASALQRRAGLALLAGRFDEAEALVHEAILHVGDDPAWVLVYGGQLLGIAIERGRIDEAVALGLAVDADPARPITSASRSMVLALAGRHDEARAELAPFAGGLHVIPHDMMRFATLATLATAAVELGDRELASSLHHELVPHTDRVVVFGFGAVCWGQVTRFLGPLGRVLGRDDAEEHLRASIAVHERLGARPFVARSQLDLAASLCDRGDRAGAAPLVAAARATAAELGMAKVAARADALAG